MQKKKEVTFLWLWACARCMRASFKTRFADIKDDMDCHMAVNDGHSPVYYKVPIQK